MLPEEGLIELIVPVHVTVWLFVTCLANPLPLTLTLTAYRPIPPIGSVHAICVSVCDVTLHREPHIFTVVVSFIDVNSPKFVPVIVIDVPGCPEI